VPVVLLTGWGAIYTSVSPEAVSVVLAKPPTLDGLGKALADATSDVAA
jgi:ActR/RegA family two-component response regulator